MEIWTPEIKLALLVSGSFLITAFLFVALMMHSIGSMSNILQHLQELSSAESEIRLNLYIGMLKQNRLRLINVIEHERRQEALLAIPLVRNSTKGKS